MRVRKLSVLLVAVAMITAVAVPPAAAAGEGTGESSNNSIDASFFVSGPNVDYRSAFRTVQSFVAGLDLREPARTGMLNFLDLLEQTLRAPYVASVNDVTTLASTGGFQAFLAAVQTDEMNPCIESAIDNYQSVMIDNFYYYWLACPLCLMGFWTLVGITLEAATCLVPPE